MAPLLGVQLKTVEIGSKFVKVNLLLSASREG